MFQKLCCTLTTTAALVLSSGCGGSGAGPDAGAIAADAAPGLDAGPDPDTGGYVDERGFSIRVPLKRHLDYVCTFKYAGEEGFLYLQSEPGVSQGWWSFAQVVTPALGTEYDYGGNHHNDSIEVSRGGRRLRYYHSSFGFGWRSCMHPDCLQVLDGTTVTEDGCTAERSLPVWCEEVADDGSVKPLVDAYKKCLGDPHAPDAGEGG